MTIPVECPECDAELNVPDNLAGKLIKCPHCGGAVRVPPDEPAPRPRRKSRPPVRRAKPKNTTAIVVGAAVALVAIIAAAVGATMLARGGKKDALTDTAQKATDTQGTPAAGLLGIPSLPANPVIPIPVPIRPPLPDGWIDFRHPQGEYSVYVPRKPFPIPAKGKRDVPAMAGFNESGYYTPNTTIQQPELVCGIVSASYPPEAMQAFRTGNMDLNVVERIFPGMKMTARPVTWQGRPGIDMTFESDLDGMMAGVAGMMGGMPGADDLVKKLPPGGVKLPNGIPTKNTVFMRYIVVNDRVFAFTIQNAYGPPTEAERRAFFESVVFGK